jgi:3-phenylpropionate/trans-cinnamate dioxygenase ferredoxin component
VAAVTLPVVEIPEGQSKVVSVDGVRVLVCHVESQFYAIGDVCTHDNGPLGEGTLQGCEVECPRHGAKFDVRTGKPTCMPAVVGVPTHRVAVDGDQLTITT